MLSFTAENNGRGASLAWVDRPHYQRWDAQFVLRTARLSGTRLVSLGDLVRYVRQGASVRELNSGDFAVHAARVADVHELTLGAGESRLVAPQVLRRHLLEPGDVIMARVGRIGRACCFGPEVPPTIPLEGLLVAKPVHREWGPVLAAALCTAAAKSWLLEAAPQDRQSTLTREDLASVPVPSPTAFDFLAVATLTNEVSRHEHAGRTQIERVRGEVGAVLESAPVKIETPMSVWFTKLAQLDGWSWHDRERYWLRERAQWRLRGLKPLNEIFRVSDFRLKTIIPRSRVRVLNTDDLRPDWYLAMPDCDHVDIGATSPDVEQPARRLFAIDRESLLIPTVGDITGEPIIVPDSKLHDANEPLAVTIHWLPLAGLPYPRALAVVLDHPFLRLQRKLAASFSTVTHITREEIEGLLIPFASAEQWMDWEAQVRQAQDHLMRAEVMARRIIATVEEWYT